MSEIQVDTKKLRETGKSVQNAIQVFKPFVASENNTMQSSFSKMRSNFIETYTRTSFDLNIKVDSQFCTNLEEYYKLILKIADEFERLDNKLQKSNIIK